MPWPWSRAPREVTEEAPPATSVQTALSRIGFGRYQWYVLCIAGVGWAADAMEM